MEENKNNILNPEKYDFLNSEKYDSDKNKSVMLTTIDNPYNPFEDFTSWLMFDIEKGYDTNGKIARIANLKDEMTEQEQEEEIKKAINRLIEIDPLDLYKKITKEDKKD